MGFHPNMAQRDAANGVRGTVDFRLQRNGVLKELEAGTIARNEVCDAHPELMRVARNMDVLGDEICPVCEDAPLAEVTYVFGPRLSPGGKLCVTPAEVARYDRRKGDFNAYDVEVCPACGWNHLRRRRTLGTA